MIRSLSRLFRAPVPTVPAAPAWARAFAPHCDPAVLHSPGSCEYCDHYPDWQAYRELAGIAFSDEQPTPEGKAPCPSTHFRPAAVRDMWGGNVPSSRPPMPQGPPPGPPNPPRAPHDRPVG